MFPLHGLRAPSCSASLGSLLIPAYPSLSSPVSSPFRFTPSPPPHAQDFNKIKVQSKSTTPPLSPVCFHLPPSLSVSPPPPLPEACLGHPLSYPTPLHSSTHSAQASAPVLLFPLGSDGTCWISWYELVMDLSRSLLFKAARAWHPEKSEHVASKAVPTVLKIHIYFSPLHPMKVYGNPGKVYDPWNHILTNSETPLQNTFQTVGPRGEIIHSIIQQTWKDPQLCHLLPWRLWANYFHSLCLLTSPRKWPWQ